MRILCITDIGPGDNRKRLLVFFAVTGSMAAMCFFADHTIDLSSWIPPQYHRYCLSRLLFRHAQLLLTFAGLESSISTFSGEDS